MSEELKWHDWFTILPVRANHNSRWIWLKWVKRINKGVIKVDHLDIELLKEEGVKDLATRIGIAMKLAKEDGRVYDQWYYETIDYWNKNGKNQTYVRS